jgi:AraC-like DNA-binding protein
MDMSENFAIENAPQVPQLRVADTAVTCDSPDAFEHEIATSMVAWRFSGQADAGRHRLTCRHVSGVRLLELVGSPMCAERGAREIAADQRDFLKVMLQRRGRSVHTRKSASAPRTDETLTQPGDIAVWHTGRPGSLVLPEHYRKFIVLVPLERIESALPNAESYDGLLMKAGTSSARLLGGWLTTLADNMLADCSEPLDSAIDMTLEVLGTVMTAAVRGQDCRPRTSLFERATKYIDRRLGDPQLTPQAVADGLNISLRYLYLLFGEQSTSVAHWIRSRRLARCHAELADRSNDRSITEIAFAWGFNDTAHFSRLFKSAYGMPPKAFRLMRRSSVRPERRDGSALRPRAAARLVAGDAATP